MIPCASHHGYISRCHVSFLPPWVPYYPGRSYPELFGVFAAPHADRLLDGLLLRVQHHVCARQRSLDLQTPDNPISISSPCPCLPMPMPVPVPVPVPVSPCRHVLVLFVFVFMSSCCAVPGHLYRAVPWPHRIVWCMPDLSIHDTVRQHSHVCGYRRGSLAAPHADRLLDGLLLRVQHQVCVRQLSMYLRKCSYMCISTCAHAHGLASSGCGINGPNMYAPGVYVLAHPKVRKGRMRMRNTRHA